MAEVAPHQQPQQSDQNHDLLNGPGGVEDAQERIIGLIVPPPEIKHIVETTAAFVAKNGKVLEDRIKKEKADNVKFSFLKVSDPYNAYYVEQLKANQSLNANDKKTESSATTQDLNKDIKQLADSAKTSVATKSNEHKDADKFLDPSSVSHTYANANLEFILDPPTLKIEDLMVLKLTAQYAAINGKNFLLEILDKEFKNPTFDFLKPQHGHFAYYTRLVEHYTRVLTPTKDTVEDLRKDLESRSALMNKVQSRVAWMHFNAKQVANTAEINEKDRIEYNQIDWNDFSVVGTVDYQEHEIGNFLAPVLPSQVGTRSIMQDRQKGSITTQSEATAADNSIQTDETKQNPEEQNVYKDYYQNAQTQLPTDSKIPQSLPEINNLNVQGQPMNVPILPPVPVQNHETPSTSATGGNQQQNFGHPPPQMDAMPTMPPQIGGEVSMPQMQPPMANPIHQPPLPQFNMMPPLPMNPNAFMPQQVPPFGMPMPQMPPNFPQATPLTTQQDLQQPKKPRMERELISEAEFMHQYGQDALPFTVSIPLVENSNNWLLNGQTLPVAIELHQTVAKLKELIVAEINIPQSKIRLQFEGSFLRDSATLAFYNINPKSTINVMMKERGGKKK